MVECDKRRSGALWSLERREGNSYMVLLCGSAVGHVDEDVDTISGGECHGSHIDRCFRDSVETSMCLRGSPSVERART
ncbi:unnamed protein product [Prunus brigantina]